MHHAALAHRAGFTTLRRTVPDGSFGQDRTPIADAIANGSSVNFGGVGIGIGGERVRCWALDDFQLRNVSLLKIDAVWSADCVAQPCPRLMVSLALIRTSARGLAFSWHHMAECRGSRASLIMTDVDEAGVACAPASMHSHVVR